MATPILTPDEWLQKVKDELKYIYSRKYQEAEGGVHEKRAACWAIHRQLRPSEIFPSEFPMIDFQYGRDNPDTLKKELKFAVAKSGQSAADNIDTYVDTHIIDNGNRMLCPVSVSVNTVKKSNYRGYISCKVIELSLARQVIWETDVENFWDLDYEERRLIEASQLHSSCKNNGNVPGKAKDLLPVMFWKEKKGDRKGWVKSSRAEDGSDNLSWANPPPWATDYIEEMKERGMGDMKLYLSKNPNKWHNAVYLLLCRFNGAGVPKKYRVQAYAGKAKNGVEKRWLEHARASKSVIKKYLELNTFCAEPLGMTTTNPKQLVDVIVGRLYAQGGRKCITGIDVKTHDNIVLFVYRAYGPNDGDGDDGRNDDSDDDDDDDDDDDNDGDDDDNDEGDDDVVGTDGESNAAKMRNKETYLIEKLKLRDMKYGMNGRL